MHSRVRRFENNWRNKLDDLLNNPAVQAGVVPFLVALVASAFLQRTRLLGLAIGAGLLAAVGLTMGFSFESLTSVRKLVLVAGAAMVASLLLEATASACSATLRATLAAAFALAALWVVQRLLAQQETGAAVFAGAAAVLYVMVLVDSFHQVGGDPVRSASSALLLGLTSGALALLGASAQLAQLGIAIGAAAGGTLLVQMIAGKRAPVGWTLGLTASVGAGLIGLLAVFTGSLPWFCLLPTLVIPWATRWVPSEGRPVWLASILCACAALIPSLLAVALAWFTGGTSPT